MTTTTAKFMVCNLHRTELAVLACTALISMLFCPTIQAQIQYGREIRVNTEIYNYHYCPRVLGLPNGTFLVVWAGKNWDAIETGVYGRWIGNDGTFIGDEFEIFSEQKNFDPDPELAGNRKGQIVVYWFQPLVAGRNEYDCAQFFHLNYPTERVTLDNEDQYPHKNNIFFEKIIGLANGAFAACWHVSEDDLYPNLYMQRFSPYGEIIETIGQAYDDKNYHNPEGVRMTPLSEGGWVVCWYSGGDGSDFGVFAREFNPDGTPKGSTFQVNQISELSQAYPSLAGLLDNSFFICWCWGARQGDNKIYGRRFSPAYTSPEFPISSHSTAPGKYCQIGVLQNGNHIVIWRDPKYSYIYAKLYAPDGSVIRDQFSTGTSARYYLDKPQFTLLDNGNFVICWESFEQDGDGEGIYAQLFDAQANEIGPEFRVNTYTEGRQRRPAMATLSNGEYVICWESKGPDKTDYDIYLRRFAPEPENRLNPFRLSFPQNGQVIDKLHVQLRWESTSETIPSYPWEYCYTVYLDTSPGFSDPRTYAIGGDKEYTVGGLKPGTTYYWKVLASNYLGDTLWSTNTNTFRIEESSGPGDKDHYCAIYNTRNDDIPSDIIRDIHVDPDQRVWIATPHGLGQYREEEQWRSFTASNSRLPNNNLTQLRSDSQGNLWMVSPGNDPTNGLIKYDGNEFTLYNSQNTPLPANNVLAFDINNANMLFLAFDDGQSSGFAKFDGTGWQLYSPDISEPKSILHDSKNNFWINALRDFYKFDGNAYERYLNCPTYSPYTTYSGFAIDRYDYIWRISHDDLGLSGIIRNGEEGCVFYHTDMTDFTRLDPFGNKVIKVDDYNNLWVLDNGIITFYYNPWEIVWNKIDSSNSNLPTNVELTALAFKGDEIWVGTYGYGVCEFPRIKVSVSSGAEKPVKTGFTLFPNYPNPFNSRTTVRFSLPETGMVKIDVYDSIGRKITTLYDGTLDRGVHSVMWNGRDRNGRLSSSGLYFCRIHFQNQIQSEKLLLLR